jgi:peptidoglycan/LPS O-acetylase OafA/YrhL
LLGVRGAESTFQSGKEKLRVIGDYSGSADNNFNLIRLAAAIMVIFSHSYALLLPGGDPLNRLLGMDASFIAVNAFFAISGFLITASYCRNASLVTYFEARVLRIFPGLFAAVLWCALLIGPLFTTMSLREYFAHRSIWQFITINSTLISNGIQLKYLLPGVFAGNPCSQAVNGSLWTLPYELWMYIGLGGLGALGFLRTRWIGNLGAATLLLFPVIMPGHELSRWANFERFGLYFLLGVVCYLNRDRIPLSGVASLTLGVATVFLYKTILFSSMFTVALVYGLFWLAYRPSGWIRKYNDLGDYSYGTYVYAFPVQQSLITLIPSLHPLALFPLASLVTLTLAALSWHFLENPALSLKRRLHRGRTRATAVATPG